MKKTILVDIGIIIEYLKTGKGMLPQAYEAYKMQIVASTYAEILASKTFQDPSLETEVIDFMHKYFEVLPINEDVAKAASKVLREKEVTFATALIAGAAVANSLELLTDDKGQFENVEGLELLKM